MSEDKGKTAPIKSKTGIDLHTHTYYSDGRYSPAELIEAAIDRGLSLLSITDHDNTRGSRAALRILKDQSHQTENGLEIIPGVEFTTRWPGCNLPPRDMNVDILGYYIDPYNAEFLAFEQATLNDIHERIRLACERLSAKGIPLAMADVTLENPRYSGAIQMVHALINKRLARDWSEATQMFDEAWLPSRETPFTIRAVIEQIHLAGGAAVLAHPTIVRPGGKPLEEKHIAELVDWGLDGLEIYHYRLNDSDRAYFLNFARQFGLVVTGGSDTHGWGRAIGDLGQQPVTPELVDALRERASQYQ